MHSSAVRSMRAKTDEKYSDEFKESQLDDFSSKHMMTKEMWDERLDLSDDHHHVVLAIYQFYYHDYLYDNEISQRKIYDWKWQWNIDVSEDDEEEPDYEEEEPHYEYAIEDFRYPQIELEIKLERFHQNACSFLPKPDTVEKLKQLYSDIKDAEGDDKKWLEALMAFDDHEFIFHNIEYRLGGNLKNKDLWLMYIEYLKTHDTQKLLQTYSKFIRFFLNDATMIAQYREAVKKYGPVLIPWKNALDFEIYDENFFEKEKACQSYKRTFYDGIPPLMIRFNPQTAATQDSLSLPKPMIVYIRENASPEVLHKLYKCCKLFRVRFPKTICCRMTVYNGNNSVDIKGLAMNITGGLNIPFDNVFIGDSFYFHSQYPLALSEFIPKIYRCAAKFINIYYQQLTMDELQKLIGHENLKSLYLWSIKNSDGQPFKIEDILQVSPYVKEIDLHGVQCTAETAKKLSEMVFKNKIERIALDRLNNDSLNPLDFAKFIKKSCKPGAVVRIKFEFDGKEAFIKKFKETVESAMGDHWKGKDKIKFYF